MLTTGEVAKLFRVSAQTVINWLEQGRMPFDRIGRGPRRLTEEAVMKYVEQIGISPGALDEEVYFRVARARTHGRAGSGPAVILTDPDLRIIGWNEAARQLFGHTQAEMLGKVLAKTVSKLGGGEASLESLVKAPWQDKSLQVEAKQESRSEKNLHAVLTFSRFYLDGMLAGYAVACREKTKK